MTKPLGKPSTFAEAQSAPRDDAAGSLYLSLIGRARQSKSPVEFFSGALRAIAEKTNSPYACIEVHQGPESIRDDCHSGAGDPAFWKDRVQRFLTESIAERRTRALLLSARGAELRLGLISVPLFSAQGGHSGALAIVAPIGESDAREKVAFLESIAALMSYLSGLIGVSADSRNTPAAPGQSLARAATYESLEELAFALTNNLRNRRGLQMVALGVVRGASVRVVSISGLSEVKPRSPGIGVLRSAMEECLDAGRELIAPAPQDDPERPVPRLQQQWMLQTRGSGVASIPLIAAGKIVAVLSIVQAGDGQLSRADVESMRTTVEAFAAAIVLVERASRGVLRHAVEAIRDVSRKLLGRGFVRLKVGAIATSLLALWLAFGALPYEVAANAILAPAEMRHVSAPFDGILIQANVVAGDRVRAGDLLCALDARDLQLQIGEVDAQKAVNEQELLRALAGGEPVEARIATLNRDLLNARRAALQRRMDAAEIRSPIDGMVVSGDLRSALGATCKQGDPFFQIAPLANWTLQVEVPEWAVDDVAPGLGGRFIPLARSEAARGFRIERVEPSALVRKGANVFIAEAVTDIDPAWMRPGMEGTARVSVGSRPSWWVLLHRAIDVLRVNFWL